MATSQAEIDRRRAVVAGIQLSTVPAIAAVQIEANNFYIANGYWSSALHDKAEAIRKSLNPMYPGSADGSAESRYILDGAGQVQPSTNGVGSLLGGLTDLFGSAASGAGSAASAAASPSNNGTLWLIIGGVGLLMLLRR